MHVALEKKTNLDSPESDGTPTLPSFARRVALTPDDGALTALRLVLAGVMAPHGAQHAFGLFGGYGFSGTYGWMTNTVGIPGLFAALAIASEVIGPILLVLGLGGRVGALLVGVVLAVAATTHVPHGFFMNWFGNQAGEGFEYHLLGVAMAAALVMRGSGALSLDRTLTSRRS